MTGRAHCQRQVAFFKIIVEFQSLECNMRYLLLRIIGVLLYLLSEYFGTPLIHNIDCSLRNESLVKNTGYYSIFPMQGFS